MWKLEPGKDGKLTKVPYNAKTGWKASSSDPNTWTDFNSCWKCYEMGNYSGIGFELSSDDDIICIDLDDKTGIGKISEYIELSKQFNSWTEISYSGKGLHIWCRGKKPGSSCRRGDLEIYERKQFIAITGNQVEGSPDVLNNAQEQIDEFYKIVDQDNKGSDTTEWGEREPELSDAEIIAKCKRNPLFNDLWHGDISYYTHQKDGSPDPSSADLALCNILASACGNDAFTIDRIFRKSKLMRSKWDEYHGTFTYGQMTIRKAITPKDVESQYDDINQVPAYSGPDIKNLKFSLNLPDNHFITKYVKTWSERNDAYQDYHYTAALTLLSIAADRKPVIFTENMGDIYSNLWTINLGQSSYSRKSTSMKPAKLIAGANGLFQAIPQTFSPEALIETLSESPGGDGMTGDIRVKSHGYHLKDECAQVLNAINNKPYMADMRELFCQLFDCESITRKLRTGKKNVQTDFHVKDPYLTLLWSTTPESFLNNVTALDALSGFLLRFIFVFPQYEKVIKPIKLGSRANMAGIDALGTAFNEIAGEISKHSIIDMIPSDEGLGRFNDWYLTRQQLYASNGSEYRIHQSILDRMAIVSLKLAILLSIGDPECLDQLKANMVSWNAKPADVQNNCHLPGCIAIPDQYIDEALGTVENYLFPVAVELLTQAETAAEQNIQVKLLQALRQAPGCRMPWVSLRRKYHLTRKIFEDAIDGLQDSEEIEVTRVGKGAGVRWVRLV
jgi:hypothetical protein